MSNFSLNQSQDLFFSCPLGLTTSLSPRILVGERGFEPAQPLDDGFIGHFLLLKSFSFTLYIYYIIFFIKNQTDLLIALPIGYPSNGIYQSCFLLEPRCPIEPVYSSSSSSIEICRLSSEAL